MKLFQRLRNIPPGQKYRYTLIVVATLLLLAPFTLIPSLFSNPDLCGPLCMRRFYLFFPGMTWDDAVNQISVASIGAAFLLIILVTTFFFGRIWCAYICPMGGVPELASRLTGERWKLEYRWLPQVPIRYGYFLTFVFLMPMLGVSACTLCNFITVPRIFQAFSGDWRGIAFLVTTVGMVNLGLVLLLGVFANKGRAYCSFLCPIGAIDALVNRLGSYFRFTRRIRVERNRCTGCNECARKCMCGAITMVDKIAVVDQLSCMSCHECADVCDWGAIDWLTVPPEIRHKRKKKNVEFHPLPEWIALHKPRKGVMTIRHLLLALLIVLLSLLLWTQSAGAAVRQNDPDGCMVCHGLEGFEFVDDRGLHRNLTIDVKQYSASLHGNVPCSDCHASIRRFPHEKDKGVDCAAECHLEEPSEGSAYTHKDVVKEMQESAHEKGRSKGFTGSNRLQESENDSNPSCRLCHSNTGYISEVQMPEFRELFQHSDEACGSCHKDDVWRERFTGHILRRLLGGRWSKAEGNAMCEKCHADHGRMEKVEREAGREKPEAASPRFIWANTSYDLTLHGRLIAAGRDAGASCLDCHAPKGLHHGIQEDEKIGASTHKDELGTTCSAQGCHGFSGNKFNRKFLYTDMHDVDLVPLLTELTDSRKAGFPGTIALESAWKKALLVLIVLTGLMLIVWLLGVLFAKPAKGKVYSALGGDIFRRRMLDMPGRKGKKKSQGKAGRKNK
jgi:polyferredoxin